MGEIKKHLKKSKKKSVIVYKLSCPSPTSVSALFGFVASFVCFISVTSEMRVLHVFFFF